MLGLLAITAGAAAKIALYIFGGVVALYVLFIACIDRWGIDFILTLFGIGYLLFWGAVVFGVIFLMVLGIGLFL